MNFLVGGARLAKGGVWIDSRFIPFGALRWNFGLIECWLKKGKCEDCTNGRILNKLETFTECGIRRYMRAMIIVNKKPDENAIERVKEALNKEF